MAKTVAAQMLATIPARHDNNVILEAIALKHPEDDLARTGFAIIILDLPFSADQAPCVVGGLGKFLGFLQFGNKGFRLFGRAANAAGDRIFGAAVADYIVEGLDGDRHGASGRALRGGQIKPLQVSGKSLAPDLISDFVADAFRLGLLFIPDGAADQQA